MLEDMLRHIDQASLFGRWPVGLLVLLAADFALTLVHSLQELRGRLWRYFGAIAGIWIPDPIGVLSFFVLLTLGLWAVGWLGITGYVPFVGRVDWVAIACIGMLIGGRLSDRRYSHVRLDRQGYRPNPGLRSTPYYLAEALLLALVFIPGIIEHYSAAITGFALGWGFFFVIHPFLRSLRVIPWLRREPWKAGEPGPAWAKLPRATPMGT